MITKFDEATVEQNFAYWTMAKEVLARNEIHDDDSPETVVFRVYFECGNAQIAQQYLRDIEYKILSDTGKMRYLNEKDISQILDRAEIPDKELELLVRDLRTGNVRLARKIWG